jgi:hypothetical protein
MAEHEIKKGPGISSAQKIGDKARSVLYANKPDNWILGESPGDDFGYDFQVTAFDPGGMGAQCAFSIQLKGTTQKDARLADGSCLSYAFDRTTLNMWHRSGLAVLVVIADLIDTQDIKVATAHFHLANYDLDDLLDSLPPEQKTVRLRVPIDQVVHAELDILPTVLPYLDDMTEARRVAREMRRATGSAIDNISLGTSALNKSTSLRSPTVDDDIDDLIESSAARVELQAALAALRIGDYERVLEMCPHPSAESCEKSPRETAIGAHLRSLALDAIGDSDGANLLASLAVSLLPDWDGTVGAAAQKKLDAVEFGEEGRSAREAILKSLEVNAGISATSIKAKILALNGDFSRAREVLRPFPPEKTIATGVVVSIVERDWNRAKEEVAEARKLANLRPRQRLWLEVMDARATFELALASVPRPQREEFVIPST